MRFGDIQSITSGGSSSPDVGVLTLRNGEGGDLLAIGMLKTFWTFKLEQYPVTSNPIQRIPLEHPVGMYRVTIKGIPKKKKREEKKANDV